MEQKHVFDGLRYGDKSKRGLLADQIVGVNSKLLQQALENIEISSKRWLLHEVHIFFMFGFTLKGDKMHIIVSSETNLEPIESNFLWGIKHINMITFNCRKPLCFVLLVKVYAAHMILFKITVFSVSIFTWIHSGNSIDHVLFISLDKAGIVSSYFIKSKFCWDKEALSALHTIYFMDLLNLFISSLTLSGASARCVEPCLFVCLNQMLCNWVNQCHKNQAYKKFFDDIKGVHHLCKWGETGSKFQIARKGIVSHFYRQSGHRFSFEWHWERKRW